MLRSRLVGILLAAMLALPLSASAADFTMNFGTVAPAGTPWADQLEGIKKEIESKSEGRIKVRLFLGGVMGGEVEMVRDIMEGGRLQAGGFSTAAVATGANVPALQIPELPFLFSSLEEADHVLDTVLYEPIKGKMKRRRLLLSMWAENGWRSFYTKNSAVKSLTDLQAHKMRTQESKVHKAMYAALGTQAVPIPTPEVLDALTRGTVDGFDNTSLFGQASGWFEPTKFYTLSKHIYQPAAIVFSQDWYDGLPDELKPIIDGLQASEQQKGREGVRALEAELLANFKEFGMTVYQPTSAEMQPFKDAVAPVYAQLADEMGADLLQKVLAARDAYRASK
jgi:TRAP-type transport system periplasmic protein